MAGELIRLQPRDIELLPGSEGEHLRPAGGSAGGRVGGEPRRSRAPAARGQVIRHGGVDHAWTLAEAPDGAIWVGHSGLCRLTATGCEPEPVLAEQPVRALLFDRRGRLWIGAGSGLFVRDAAGIRPAFPGGGGPAQPVRVMYEAQDGDLWLGTFGDGLYRVDARTGIPQRFGRDAGLPGVSIRDIGPDPAGDLWLGTEDAGLVRARRTPTGWSFRAIGAADGLPVAGVHRVLADDLGRLWLASNSGLGVIRRADAHAFADEKINKISGLLLGTRDGMPHPEGNGGVQGAGIRLRDGRLLFPPRRAWRRSTPSACPWSDPPWCR
ncbi:MAG: two-component regulator propeller domain-containing protein [bacterium]